eukprot:321850-Prymnesium_polylepis.1
MSSRPKSPSPNRRKRFGARPLRSARNPALAGSSVKRVRPSCDRPLASLAHASDAHAALDCR